MKAQIVKIDEKTLVIKNEIGKFATISKNKIDFEYKLGDIIIIEKNKDEIYFLPQSAANFQASADFWETKQNHIHDGSGDRKKEIEQTQDKRKLSKNRNTQNAINQVITFGILLTWCGILLLAVVLIDLIYGIAQFISTNPELLAENLMPLIFCTILCIIPIVIIILGNNTRKLSFAPSTIKALAIIFLIIGGLILKIDAIILLTKIRQYEDWYYGDTD